MIDYYLNRIDSINEVYAGRIPEVQAIEDAVHIARQKYLGKMSLFKNSYKDQDLFLIQNAIEKAFGFYSVSFILEFSMIQNAYTSPIVYNIDVAPEDYMIPFKGGYKYDPKARFCTCICMTSSIFCDATFTDAEITAAILHEIGHNFIITKNMEAQYKAFRDAYEIMKTQTGLLKIFTAIPLWIYDKLYSLKWKEINNNIWNYIKNHPVLASWYDILFKYNSLVVYIQKLVSKVSSEWSGRTTITKIVNTLQYSMLQLNIHSNTKLIEGKAREYLADSFATIYGYGPESISFIKKLELSKKNIDPGAYMPHVIIMRKISELPFLTSAYAKDVHPDTAMRLSKQLDDLKREAAKSNLDSKTKKELQVQIAKMEKIKNEMIDEANNLPIADRKRYIKLLWKDSLENKSRTETEEDYVSGEEMDKYYSDLLKRNR